MIKSVTVTNYLGESLVMELARPEKSGLIIKSIDGLGPVSATINFDDISSGDGALFNSARMGTRNIVFKLLFLGKPSIEDARQLTYKYFPTKKHITLLFETTNRKAKTTGYVEHNEPDIFSKSEGATISIRCPDAYFYCPEDEEALTVFSGIVPNFEFPFSNESLDENLIEFGIIKTNREKNIYYSGDGTPGVIITIHATGPAKNIIIYNTGSNEVMVIDTDKLETLTGCGIVAGDDIIICTIKGRKSISLIRNGVTTNVLNTLNKGSQWFTLSRGDNIFAYAAESGENNLQFTVQNQVLYEGI